jgi:hypothetical protein
MTLRAAGRRAHSGTSVRRGSAVGSRRSLSASTACGESEHPRNDLIADLDHPFYLERCAHEGHEVVGEGYVAGSDATADARTELLGGLHPTCLSVAGDDAEARVALSGGVDVVSDETRVNAQAHQASARLQHPSDLSQDLVEGINVGVDERETDGLDARGSQWQLVRVGLNYPAAALPSNAELIHREINPADLPAASAQSSRRGAGTAPDVDDEPIGGFREFSKLPQRRVWSLADACSRSYHSARRSYFAFATSKESARSDLGMNRRCAPGE